LIDAVHTKGALLDRSDLEFALERLLERRQLTLKVPTLIDVDVHSTVGASSHTGSGSTANILINEDDTVRPAGDGLGRARLHAGGIFTVHA
jgi:hypothetical protein